MTDPKRNDSCPCGSGRKFKRCCGGNSAPSRAGAPEFAGRQSLASRDRSGGRDVLRQQAGSISEADRVYALGNTLAMQGRMDQAIVYYQSALAIKPGFVEAHNNLANALWAQGLKDEAITQFERVLALRPDHAQAHNNLGNALWAQGRLDQAITHYERALALKPDYAQAHNNLGLVLAARGRTDEAVTCYQRALAGKPDFAEAHNNLGNALCARGENEQGIIHYERALVLLPNYPQAHNNLANALSAVRRLDEAIAHYERALALLPGYAEACNNLGLALVARGHPSDADRAVACYEHALALNPNFAEAHYNLGNALWDQGKTDRATASLTRALELRPDYAEAHSNLGAVFCAFGMMDRAVIHCERALALRPDDALAHNNLANALWVHGRMDEAVLHYERALALQPDYAEAHSNLLMALNYSSGDPQTVWDAHRDFAQQREAPLAGSRCAPDNDRSADRRLRIGYVSSDLRRHSVAFFFEPVLAHHDRDRFEIFCYYNYANGDDLTERLQLRADHWRCISRIPDDLVARQIREDRIDILVDLNGHTGHNRLLVFARKPAPVQVTWLGYPNTSGLSAMDYRITDGFADPVGMTERFHSEKLVRMPECFSCYQPPPDAPEVSALPAREKGYVNFGSFNNLSKVTPDVMAVWAEILQAVPGSRLMLKNLNLCEQVVQQMVRDAFVRLGISPERLDILGPDKSPQVHLERYASIDIGLDPFPYNGATTTCEALWMGIPVVVLAGRTHAGRVGVSQLSNLGLTELIAQTSEGYVDTAVRLAGDLERLGRLREELRPRFMTSPLTNAPRFTRNLEQVFLAMWKDWCCGAQDQPGPGAHH